MKKCYRKSFLTPEEAISMLSEMERLIGMNYFNSLEQYYLEKQNRIDKINARKERLSEEEIQRQKEIKKEKKQLIMKKNDEFHNYYKLIKKINNNYDTQNRTYNRNELH